MKKAVKLKFQKTVKIRPKRPFDFDSTFHKPDHFTSGDNFWEPGVRWQTFNWRGKSLGVKLLNKGSIENPLIEIKIYSKNELLRPRRGGVSPSGQVLSSAFPPATLRVAMRAGIPADRAAGYSNRQNKFSEDFVDSLIGEIKYRYNLDLDLEDFYKSFKKDKFLAPVLKKWKGMRPGHPSSLYEYIIIGIVLQNASVRRSVQMFRALLENYGTLLEFDGKKLWCFWNPSRLENITEQDLRDLKVGYRAKSIKRVDDYFKAGLIDELDLREKERETQMRELLKLYGVGPATVWYLLFDVFHHWDFFNHISPWEQKIYSKLFFNKGPENPVPVEKLLRHFEKYGKYKQLAVHYIWEDLWWRRLASLAPRLAGRKRKNENIPWLEKEIRI